eukprot:6466219-Amphidinium_carterae.4
MEGHKAEGLKISDYTDLLAMRHMFDPEVYGSIVEKAAQSRKAHKVNRVGAPALEPKGSQPPSKKTKKDTLNTADTLRDQAASMFS